MRKAYYKPQIVVIAANYASAVMAASQWGDENVTTKTTKDGISGLEADGKDNPWDDNDEDIW